MFTRILFNRLEKYLENNNIICPEQIGFKRGARISDHIFTLKSLIDKFFKNNKYLYACFEDLKKAFDTANRQALLFKLNRYNIRGHFLNIIEDMYNDVSFSIRLANGITQPFQTSIGVKQGWVLIPTIFFGLYE